MKALLALLFLLWTVPASAHKPSDSYLSLRVDGTRIEGRWDIALRDLDLALGLDGDGDGRLTWNELRARHGAIEAYALSRLSIAAGGAPCTLAAGSQLVDEHTDGAYTVLPLRGTCTVKPAELTIAYRLFGDVDAQHRGLLRIGDNGDARTAILGGERPVQTVPLAQASAFQQFLAYVRHGAWHIWIGYDHVLFLVSLLLPAVLVRRDGGWQHVPAFRGAATDVLKTVTAFTLAHSLTLALAALGVVAPPSRWVESAIAASVAVAALNNVWPVLPGPRWAAAFLFGLVHGFGFAGVLADLGLPRGALAASLSGFNLGVELGQLAIVAVVLPLAFALRATRAYRRVLLPAGSLAIALVAFAWLGERAFDLPAWTFPFSGA
ncbi:HupE/UreJ family protein [Massilia dura]|uniref:HupE/UreJ family protein n=1 Tax=Pseudoduganella dura TaxID=321982 RepID=A0A6I3XNN0_9BURK|nr:HupE/UreJ family protein [Pseudoduganella dura]MUI14228.1 HupE/UreJ family protein [Pseudoduganella dura]GGX76378.1 membrane protein [Pseudoduganella dura]